MLTVSDELKNAFMKSERTIYVRIKIGNRTFDNDNVVSVEYDSGSLSGEVFAIGSTYSNSIKITFSELVEGLKELDEVSYEIGIKLLSGAIEYVPMGIFIINDAIGMDRNNNKTTIECMDKMVMMGGTYVSSLTYPAAIREVALEIANKAGVVVDSTSFARLSADNIAKPEGYTYREAIGLIAQFEAGFATFNRFGKLEIRTLSDPNFAIPPDNYFSKGLVKNEVFFRLGGISCTTDDGDTFIQSGNSSGNQVDLENRVMTKVLLDKIYQKIQTINYYPFSLSWQGNPVIEAGDWIEVEDLQGNKFKTPNLNYSLSFNGGLSAKSSAETVTQSDVTYQYKSPLQQKIEWIHARIDAAGGNVVYEGIDEPTNPKEGDLWFKIIGPDVQILIYKKDSNGVLSWVLQISTADLNKVAEEVNKIIDQANKDRTKAEQDFEASKQLAKQYTDAEVLKFDTKFNTETGAIRNEVTTGYNNAVTAGKAHTDTKSNEFNSQLVLVKTDIANTVLKADAAVLKADKAIEDVGFLKPDVATAKANAATAIQDATTATKNATTAIQNAQTALNSVATLSQEVDVSITNINGELTRKVSQTTFNTLSGTVGTHTTQISQTQTALLAKAESSLVNTIKGTVDTHTTQIKVVSDGLELKAESSLVNTVKGTVDSHTTQINANSQAITARLTSVQIETLLTGKQYVNQTTLNATSNGLTAQITQVSTNLDNLQIGGTNLIPGTSKAYRYLQAGGWGDVWADGGIDLLTKGIVVKGETYTLRVLLDTGAYPVKAFVRIPSPSNLYRDFVGNIVPANSKGYSTVTFTVPQDATGNVIAHALRFEQNSTPSHPVGYGKVKLEKGTKPTDWSPAPEDMATLEKVVTIEANINGINLLVANKAEQSQVTQLAGQITTKVESATFESRLTQLDGSINLRVGEVQTNLDKLEIGGRNLLTGTTNEFQSVTFGGWDWYYSKNVSNWNVNDPIVGRMFLKPATSEASVMLHIRYSNGSYNQIRGNVIPAGSSGYSTVYAVIPNRNDIVQIQFSIRHSIGSNPTNIVQYKEIKVEKGTKATDWSPAPEDMADKATLLAQINLSTEGVLIQGKVIQLDGQVNMDAAFINKMKAFSIEAVNADIANIRTKVLTADVITSTHIKADNAMMDKLFTTVAVVDYLFTKTAFVNNLSVKTLTAITANIATIRSQVLIANVVEATHLKSDTALIDKIFATDANVQRLTAKTAFINSVKAVDITADKVTGGTFNAALMNVVGLNANSMTTGTLNGANYSNNLNTGIEIFRNPSNGSTLSIQQDKFYFNTSGASHYLIPDNEGLAFVPASGNTGNNRNAGIRLQSTNFNFVDLGYGSDGGFLHRVGSYPDTMAFINKDGGGFTFSHTGVLDVLNANTRRWDMTIGNYGQFKYGKSAIQLNGYDSSTIPKVKIVNPSTGALATLDVGYINLGNQPSSVELSNVGTSFKIEHVAGRNWIFADGLNGTLTYGITRLALNGHNNASARLSVYGAGGTSYGYMSAANFDVQSERKYKDNIVDFGSALSIISTMKIHQYEKNGISEIGIITDEAPLQLLADNDTKVSLYDYASLAIRGVQELGDLTWHHEVKLSKHELRIKELEEKIKLLESVA